jgi:poly-gamma-glutamate capsule biosynthesis protein CapA/YwtB (metallophosphatase superfamily)
LKVREEMPDLVTLQAVGDIGFVGRIRDRIRLKEDGYPFSGVAKDLAAADIMFGNLEIPVLEREDEGHNPIVPRTLIATVESIGRLRSAGFHILCLANNHVMDHGPQGLRTTLKALRGHDLLAVGAGEDLAGARRPVIVERKGLRFGFLAYTSSANTWAHAGGPGAAPMRQEIVEEDIRALRRRVDVLLVSLHFGLMYTDYPRLNDQGLLRRWIDLGVDAILGHHPHVCQGIEAYGRGLIAYSLGEFVFDPRAGNVVATQSLARRAETMILRCRFGKPGLAGWEIIPVRIGADLAPKSAEGEDAIRIRHRFEAFSKPIAGDGLKTLDLEALTGSVLVGHESRVLWHNIRRLHFGYVLGKFKRIRLRHVRMFLGWVRHRLARPSTTLPR